MVQYIAEMQLLKGQTAQDLASSLTEAMTGIASTLTDFVIAPPSISNGGKS